MDALVSEKVRSYVTDFPTKEIVGVRGAIVIPHLGASTEESEDNCAKMAVAEVMDYLQNGNITHSVNYPDCDMGVIDVESEVSGQIAKALEAVEGVLKVRVIV